MAFFSFIDVDKRPIGIFDSGVGGISIYKEIRRLLPQEDIIYLADSANAPYGNKSDKEILGLSIKNTEFLLNHKVKLVVVACNTATTNAIKYLRRKYNLHFIGIEPAIKPASLNTKTKAIGILATKGTLSSELFHNTANLYSDSISIIEKEGEGIVPLIESGKTDSSEMRILLNKYLKPLLEANIDHLVLGCTHYPYLIPILAEILPQTIKIIDSGEAVARQTKAVLKNNNLINTSNSKGRSQFLTNGNIEVLKSMLNEDSNVRYLNF